MKAISIRQPWASFIVDGPKCIENRSRNIVGSYRGRVLIHASRYKAKQSEQEEIWDWLLRRGLYGRSSSATGIMGSDWNALPCGYIIGVADLVDVVTDSEDPWFVGPVGLVLANVRKLTPHACKGKLGLFEAHHPKV